MEIAGELALRNRNTGIQHCGAHHPTRDRGDHEHQTIHEIHGT